MTRSICSQCHAAAQDTRAKFCPRCGADLTGAASPLSTDAPRGTEPPIRLEKRGSLVNLYFLSSVVLVIAGTVVAGEGDIRLGVILLAIGLPLLVLTAIVSLSGRV